MTDAELVRLADLLGPIQPTQTSYEDPIPLLMQVSELSPTGKKTSRGRTFLSIPRSISLPELRTKILEATRAMKAGTDPDLPSGSARLMAYDIVVHRGMDGVKEHAEMTRLDETNISGVLKDLQGVTGYDYIEILLSDEGLIV